MYDEVDKWNAAFQGKDYFCGDLDAEPLRGNITDLPDSGLRVSVCSKHVCARRHVQRRNIRRHNWQFSSSTPGRPAPAQCRFWTMRLSRRDLPYFLPPLPRAGLDLEEATFRVRLLMKSIYRHDL